MASYLNPKTGEVISEEQYRARYGTPPPVSDTAKVAPSEPKKSLGQAAFELGDSITGGKQIGESLYKAGANIGNLITGGPEKFTKNLQKVDVPALIGDYGKAATAVGAAVVPISKAAHPASTSRHIGASELLPRTVDKAAALAKNVGKGAGLGYASDVSGKLKEGEEGTFTPGMGTAIGAALGPLAGAALPGKRAASLPDAAINKGKDMLAAQAAKKVAKGDDQLLELVMSDAGKKKSINAFKLAGQEGGVTEVGGSKKFKIKPTATDKARMESVRGIVDPGKSPVENNTRLNNEIARISKEELEPFLRENPRAFNAQTINAKLRALEMPDLFKTDDSLGKTYDLVRQRMMGAIDRNPKTMEGLWKARKEFDQEVQEQFGDAVFNSEKNTAIKRAIKDMRKEVNTYIADEIGGTEFKDYMAKLNNIYSVRDNVSEKAYKLLGTNKFKRWWDQLSQTQKNIVIYGGGTIAGGKILFGGLGEI